MTWGNDSDPRIGMIWKVDTLYTPTVPAPFGRNESMKKPSKRKASAKKTPDPRSARHASAKRPRSRQNKASVTLDTDGKLTFNHAMVYVKDVERGLIFYRD